jgi:hypothetical protein
VRLRDGQSEAKFSLSTIQTNIQPSPTPSTHQVRQAATTKKKEEEEEVDTLTRERFPIVCGPNPSLSGCVVLSSSSNSVASRPWPFPEKSIKVTSNSPAAVLETAKRRGRMEGWMDDGTSRV